MNGKISDSLANLISSTSAPTPDRVPLKDAHALPQRDEWWECTARRARLWVTPPHADPYRPYIILIVSRTGFVVGFDITENPPTPAQIVNVLATAMLYPVPGAGTRRRPVGVYLDHESLAVALRPHLATVDIRCEFRHTLREAYRALRSFERRTEGSTIPSVVESPGVTRAMARAFFEAAAFFYREAPWRWIADSQPIEIRHPAPGQPRYAVVMGQGGVAYGLAIHDSKEILHRTYAGSPDDGPIDEETWTVVFFGDAVEMPFDDLDAIETYGWPIAGPHAYPLIVRAGMPDRADSPSRSDLLRTEAALRTIPRFLRNDMRAHQGFAQPAEANFTIATADGEGRISLSYPVPGFEMPVEDEWFAAPGEDEIQWRNAQLLSLFERWLHAQGLSTRTIDKHMRNSERFAICYLFYEGGSIDSPCPADEAAPADIDEFLADWLPYEVPGSPVAAVTSHIASLKKFYRCLRDSGEMAAAEAAEILALLQEDRAYYLDLARDFEEDLLAD